MPGRKTVTFDNFSSGEAGELFDVKPPPGSWTGQNVVRYLDGSIGPRAGLKKFTLASAPTGAVAGFGVNDGQSKVWFIIGTATYQFPSTAVSQTVVTCTGATAETANRRIRTFAEDSTLTYFTNYADQSYSLNHPTATVTALAASPGGRIATMYGDLMLVGSGEATEATLYWSAQADFTTWDTANDFLPIGSNYGLYLMAVQRTSLVMAKHDGSWWRLSGTPGVDEVLRQVAKGIRPHNNADFGATRYGIGADGRVWFMPQHGDYPAVFTGAGFQTFEHLKLNESFVTSETVESGLVPSIGVTGLTNATDALFVSGSKGSAGSAYDDAALLFHRAVWSKHTFDVAVSGWVDGRLNVHRYAFLCDGGAAAGTAKFYVWPYDLGRPPISGGTFESLGDDSSTPPTCEFTIPEWWAKDGERITVRAVVVDFQKWDHGFASDNSITVTVTPLRHDGSLVDGTGGGDASAVTASWTEDPGEASSSGTRDRQKFVGWSAQPEWGNGFKIKLGALVGVGIQRVHVVVETSPEQI